MTEQQATELATAYLDEKNLGYHRLLSRKMLPDNWIDNIRMLGLFPEFRPHSIWEIRVERRPPSDSSAGSHGVFSIFIDANTREIEVYG